MLISSHFQLPYLNLRRPSVPELPHHRASAHICFSLSHTTQDMSDALYHTHVLSVSTLWRKPYSREIG